MRSKIDSILQSGASIRDVKASMDEAFAEFKDSDAFQSLPQEVQQQMEKLHQSGPPEAMDQGPQMMRHLEQLGSGTKASLWSQLIGGDASELQASLLELTGTDAEAA